MGSIVVNSNIASLNAQRRFAQSTASLQESFSRLSSGLRINKAKDDASGLAISSELQVDARVFAQGIRNLNDGIGLLNIAEAAAGELANVTLRLRELSTQASNGTLGTSQRAALDQEAQALVQEYNRIVESTQFNDISVYGQDVEAFRLQAGYGALGGLDVSLLSTVGRVTGDGTFQTADSSPTGDFFYEMDAGDLNGDGLADVVLHRYGTGELRAFLGDGNGSFSGGLTIGVDSSDSASVSLVDVNNDNQLDLVHLPKLSGIVNVMLGNGDGTFQGRLSNTTAYVDGSEGFDVSTGDFNNDGKIDLVARKPGDGASVFLGNGDGTFVAPVTYATSNLVNDTVVADINGDGLEDIITSAYSPSGAQGVYVLVGNSDGSFKATVEYRTDTVTNNTIALGDFNSDGSIDIVVGDQINSDVSILLGNSDGTFQTGTTFSSAFGPLAIETSDFDGDGFDDFIVRGANANFHLYTSQGDGSFALSSIAAGGGGTDFALADIDGDGIDDIVTQTSNAVLGLIANTQETTQTIGIETISNLSVATISDALEAQGSFDDLLEEVNGVRATIGALQSRIGTAIGNLSQSKESFQTARSRIVDLDVAHESASLVRNQILQQAGAAVLSQANQTPALALALLE